MSNHISGIFESAFSALGQIDPEFKFNLNQQVPAKKKNLLK
jgi:hypothetical protein